MKVNKVQELVNVIIQHNNSGDTLDLLNGLLSPAELDEIACRLQIVRMLKAGVSQREIVKKLQVGIATVTRGSKEIKKGRFKKI